MKGWKKTCHANSNQKRTGVVVLISDKIDFKTKIVTKDERRNFVMIKGVSHQEDLTVISIYAPNNRAPKYMKQKQT